MGVELLYGQEQTEEAGQEQTEEAVYPCTYVHTNHTCAQAHKRAHTHTQTTQTCTEEIKRRACLVCAIIQIEKTSSVAWPNGLIPC